MQQQFTIFEFMFDDPELEADFINFFHRNLLEPLFANEHRTTPIKVSWADARGIVNPSGAWVKDFKELSDLISFADDNLSFSEVMFKLIHQAGNFTTLGKRVRKLNKFAMNQIDPKHMYNMWNIVWYSKILN